MLISGYHLEGVDRTLDYYCAKKRAFHIHCEIAKLGLRKFNLTRLSLSFDYLISLSPHLRVHQSIIRVGSARADRGNYVMNVNHHCVF